jgi:hypothetical protein
MKYFLLLLLSVSTLQASAQKKVGDIRPADLKKLVIYEDSLAVWARTTVQDSVSENRLAAQELLLPMLKKALAVPNSFNYPFDSLRNISILTAPDKSFRILTWQLFIDENHYKYFGFIQPNSSKSTLYSLNDVGKDIQKPENQFLTPEKWLGCLYYNIKEFKNKEGEKRYLLFGFNSNNDDEKMKVLEVLAMKSGRPSFGAPIFETVDRGRKKTQNRLVFYYASESTMTLNYDAEMDMVVHDHLEETKSRNPAIPYTFVADGTYEAYNLKKGIWVHIDQLPNTQMSEAPRPKPVLDGTRKKVGGTKEEVQNFKFPDNGN